MSAWAQAGLQSRHTPHRLRKTVAEYRGKIDARSQDSVSTPP